MSARVYTILTPCAWSTEATDLDVSRPLPLPLKHGKNVMGCKPVQPSKAFISRSWTWARRRKVSQTTASS